MKLSQRRKRIFKAISYWGKQEAGTEEFDVALDLLWDEYFWYKFYLREQKRQKHEKAPVDYQGFVKAIDAWRVEAEKRGVDPNQGLL